MSMDETATPAPTVHYRNDVLRAVFRDRSFLGALGAAEAGGPPPGPPDFGDLTLFAGQPDPADASHFTFDYQTPAGRGTIDGRIQPDDTIQFQATSGPLAP